MNMKNITHSKLTSSLKKGAIAFTFVKINGQKRKAYGTLNENNMPKSLTMTEETIENNKSTLYFDLDKAAWRSISKESAIYID